METFELILMLLGVILISTVVSQSLSRVSLPLVQIALGVVLSLIAGSSVEFHVDPELFLILFIAPLLFDESRHANKQELWKNKGSIISLAIGLVLLSTLIVGFVLKWFIPTIPLAAAFALGAALGPTDAVAVSALSKEINLSPRQKSMLSGESLINDASGVVSFQFAVAAAVTGIFSVKEAGETFAFTFLGGILAGLLLGAISLFILKRIREHGFESTTVHVVFELFMPFIIFFIAEQFHVSGILAVVAAGLVITLFPQKLTPMNSRTNIVSKNVWEVVVFVINGVLFVLLGMELPLAFMAEWDTTHIFSNLTIILYVLLVTFLIVGTRFVWILGMEFFHKDKRVGKKPFTMTPKLAKDALVTTLAGPKGAISLSIAFTIPFTVASGAEFPYRDFLIFVASGTILCTLLLANFVVPLLSPKQEDEKEHERRKNDLDIEMLQNVIKDLKSQETTENSVATNIVIRHYRDRVSHLRYQDTNSTMLRKLRLETLEFQRAAVQKHLNEGTAMHDVADEYIKRLDRMISMVKRSERGKRILETFTFWKRSSRRIRGKTGSVEYEEAVHNLRLDVEKQTTEYLVKRLAEAAESEKNCLATLLAEHRSMLNEVKAESTLFGHENPKQALSFVHEVESEGLRLELDQIQTMYEDGRLDREDARELREEVYLMQTDLSYR